LADNPQAEDHRADAVALFGCKAEVDEERQGGGRLAGINLPVNNLVMNILPAHLALQLDIEPVFFEKAHFLRDDNWGAVVFGKESHDKRFASRNSLDRGWFAAIHINQIIIVA